MNGLTAGGGHLVHLGGQPHQQKVAAMGLQLSDVAPVPYHQQGVAHLQRLVHQLACQRLTVAAQPHHAQT